MVDTGKSKKSSNLVKVAETAEASEGVKTATIEAAGGKTTAAATHAVRVRGGKATPLTLCGFLSRLSTLSFLAWIDMIQLQQTRSATAHVKWPTQRLLRFSHFVKRGEKIQTFS